MFVLKSKNISKNKSLQFWFSIFILLVFCFFIFIFGIGRWDLWNPDEPRYAQVAREMVERGDWVLMHLNGKIYGDKPPLFFWLIAISSYLWNGFSSFSVRFPSALFGTLTVFVTFLLGISLYSLRTGFLSGLILMTSIEFAYLSTRANIDSTLTFFTTASILSFLLWLRFKEYRNGQEKMKNVFLCAFYITMALATLTKGPVGFIIPLMVSLIYLVVQKEWESIKEMRLLPGMLLFIIIVLAWYLPAVLKGGGPYLKETLFKHTVDAYAKGWTHVKPIYYYLFNFPLDFFPWVLFLPGAIIFYFIEMRRENRRKYLFLLIWFLSIFLFFSFSKGKRPIYLLPLYPATSLMVGKSWNDYISFPDGYPLKIFISLPIKILVILLFLMGTVPFLISIITDLPVSQYAPRLIRAVINGAETGTKYLSYIPQRDVISFVLLFLVSGIFLFLSQIKKFKFLTFIFIVVVFGFGFFYGTRNIFPTINPYKSARFICQEIISRIQPGEKLCLYGGFGTGPYNFYTGIVPIVEIEKEGELIDFFRSEERIFCLFKYGDYEKLKKEVIGIPFHLIKERRVGDNHIALVSNR